jgi:hypothetical protein
MFEEFKKKYEKKLTILLNDLDIKDSIEELIDFESVFLSIEYEKTDNTILKRAILYGNLKFESIKGKLRKTNKKKIIFNFGKKLIKKENDKNSIKNKINKLKLIAILSRQLKLIKKVELEDKEIDILLKQLY